MGIAVWLHGIVVHDAFRVVGATLATAGTLLAVAATAWTVERHRFRTRLSQLDPIEAEAIVSALDRWLGCSPEDLARR